MERESEEKYVEHARKVHFTLVLTCFALFIASTLPHPRLYENALTQAQAINGIAWNWSEESLSQIRIREVKKYLERNPATKVAENTSIRVDFLYKNNPKSPKSYSLIVHRNDLLVGMPLPNGFEKPILGTFVGPDNIDANLNNVPKQIVRLTDFISVWNLLNKIKYYYCVRESGIFLNQTIATDIVDESFNLKTEYSYGEKYLFPHQNGERPAYQHANLRKSLRRGRYRVAWIPRIEWINQKYVGKSSHALIGWFMSDFPHSHSFFIPVDVKKIPIDAQSYFIKMNEKTIKWHRGQFNKTFHELYKVTLDRTSLTLGDLISDLIIQAEKSQDSVQLFGAKVARSAITSWGIAIICLVQLYFLLHIRTLRALNIFIGNIPWIMGYRDKLSQSVSIISIVLLPIIVVITLCFEGITLSEDHLIILAIATLGFLGVFLSFWTLKVFISLRRVMGLSKGDNMDNKEMIVEGGNETLGDVGKKETF